MTGGNMGNSVFFEYKNIHTVFEAFKEKHSDMVQRGTNYEPYDHMSIIIRIPSVGKLIYEYFGDQIIWLERWADKKETKQQEMEYRSNVYKDFHSVVKEYINKNNITQQQLSAVSGISRRSINKYLNGNAIPKVSTMKKICESINIEI